LDKYLDRAYGIWNIGRFHYLARRNNVLRQCAVSSGRGETCRNEVTHITKFFGDWYSPEFIWARARFVFISRQWRASVESNAGAARQVYSVVHNGS